MTKWLLSESPSRISVRLSFHLRNETWQAQPSSRDAPLGQEKFHYSPKVSAESGKMVIFKVLLG